MKFWYVASKDLKIQFKDRGAMILLFVVPIVVITIASFALSGMFGGGAAATEVPLVDLDQSDISRQVVAGLKEIDGLVIEDTFSEGGVERAMTEEQARKRIEDGDRAAAILIPQSFGQKIEAGEQTEFIVLQDPGQQIAPSIVRGVLNGFATSVSADAIAVRVAVQEVMVATRGQANPKEIAQSALARSRELWDTPAVSVRSEDVLVVAGQEIDPFKQNVPGYAVMFALFTMMSGGTALLSEKELGTFRRLLAAPIGKSSILAGKLLPNFITALLQITVFFAFGHFVFGMELGNSLPGLAIMAGAVALAATSMGILMAALVKTEAQLSGISVLIILAMSSLGGSWWPLDIVPDFMRTLAHLITINAWAMDGFKDLLWYGRGVADILPEVGALLVIATGAFSVGLWRFRFD